MTQPKAPLLPLEKLPDATKLMANFTRIAERSQRLVQEYIKAQSQDPFTIPDRQVIARTFLDVTQKLFADPGRLAQTQMAFWQDALALWQQSSRRMLGESVPPVASPAPGDKRFQDKIWVENALFDFIKQSYLLTARSLHKSFTEVEGLDAKTAEKVDFYTRQLVDSIAPTNFVLSNPKVLQATLESSGENLVQGLENLLADLTRGKGELRIRMTDLDAFHLGGNIAVTPGKVVYQTDLMQLIQYQPSTAKVFKRPLLIVPPWINKYYILDLKPQNSFIKWAVDQGFTVFVLSWINPDERLADKDFEHYLLEGTLAALNAIEQATGEREVNAVAYCLGGTLLTATLAYLAAQGDSRIQSATCFTTMLDFTDPGELSVFIDEEQISLMEQEMAKKGYLDGSKMAGVFNMLRANDLIWSFVVNNYLLGREPMPFDLLYWNSDSTRMPKRMHSFYLRNMYLDNRFKEPGGVTLAGVPIDLGKITTPIYFLSTREDHIAPWKSTYAGTRLPSGPVRFVLGGSGHIAGVINPPGKAKYGYWTNPELSPDPDTWLAGAEQHEGSWWLDWFKWVKPKAGARVNARVPGDGALPALEDAPGSYVKVRVD